MAIAIPARDDPTIFIDGVQLPNVVEINADVGPGGSRRVTLTFLPTYMAVDRAADGHTTLHISTGQLSEPTRVNLGDGGRFVEVND